MLVDILKALKRRLIPALLVGVCLFIYSLGSAAYANKYTAGVRLSFVYEEISDGNYPDGKRFSMMDLSGDELIYEAYEALVAKGMYEDMDVGAIMNSVSVAAYLTDGASISSVRAQGYDYSYYANEYNIRYTQPRKLHLRDASDLFGLLRPDYSQEFLDELTRLFLTYFISEHTDDGAAFKNLAELRDTGGDDYKNRAEYLDGKCGACLDYLYALEAEGVTFTSENTGLSISDLVNSYEILRFQLVKKLSDYVTAARLTNDLQQTRFLYNQKIETATLSRLKAEDETKLASSAMEAYDQNFTQNLIVVTVNDADGLYQARPKTAYDTITLRAYHAGTQAAHYADLIALYTDELERYEETASDDGEYARMCSVADTLAASVVARYEELYPSALRTVLDYLAYSNNGYYTTQLKTPNVVTSSAIAEAVKSGALGVAAVLALTVALFFASRISREYLEKLRAFRNGGAR